MQDLVEEILEIEPKTAAGIGIYAGAVVAGSRVLRYDWHAPGYVERLGGSLAEPLIRIEGGRA